MTKNPREPVCLQCGRSLELVKSAYCHVERWRDDFHDPLVGEAASPFTDSSATVAPVITLKHKARPLGRRP